MCFSFLEILATRFSRSSFEVTSQGPTLSMLSIRFAFHQEFTYGMI